MNEKMDLILYMMENGYKGDLEAMTLEEIRKVAVEFFGEDPTARQTAKVVEVDYDTDTVTVETFTGFLFSFYGCEDWMVGDCASLIMEDNGTELVYDDEIIMAQYGGWELVNWYMGED